MHRLTQVIAFLLLVSICSCKTKDNSRYAIRDFRPELQPHLVKMVDQGIVMGGDSVFKLNVTDEEIIRLGKSEHPIIRASAIYEMMYREPFNYTELILDHLDDTAIVLIDAGEFGIWDQRISDYILEMARWKTEEEKMKTVEAVLLEHNYLRSAYTILQTLPPHAKYYPVIKDMATRPRRLDPYEGREWGFNDIEYALLGLAKFKKKEDIPIIKNRLLNHSWELGDISFRLMTDYPDTTYFEVLENYHRRQFYKFSGNRPLGFSGVKADRAAPESFIDALVMQETDNSAKLLSTMLTNLGKFTCFPDRQTVMDELILAIWNHPCPAYSELRLEVKARAKEVLKQRVSISLDPVPPPFDTSEKVFRW